MLYGRNINVLMQSTTSMTVKVRTFTRFNAEYYMNEKRSEHLRPVLVQEVEDILYYGKV